MGRGRGLVSQRDRQGRGGQPARGRRTCSTPAGSWPGCTGCGAAGTSCCSSPTSRGQTPPRVSRLLLDLLRLQVEFARGRRPMELPAMRDAWDARRHDRHLRLRPGHRGGRPGRRPGAAVDQYDEGVAVLSAIWHPGFGARIRLAATAVGAVADNLPGRSGQAAPGAGRGRRTARRRGPRRAGQLPGPDRVLGSGGSGLGRCGWTRSCCGCAGSPGSTRPPRPSCSRRGGTPYARSTRSSTCTRRRGRGPCWPRSCGPRATRRPPIEERELAAASAAALQRHAVARPAGRRRTPGRPRSAAGRIGVRRADPARAGGPRP